MNSRSISDLNLEGAATVVPVPVPVKDAPMTKREKLIHWAEIVRVSPFQICLFSNLEHWTPDMLAQPYPQYNSAFTVAANDSKFQIEGLADSSPAASMKFFDLSQTDLHTFSCNCGGHMSNRDMASRIEKLAGPAPGEPTQRGFFRSLMG